MNKFIFKRDDDFNWYMIPAEKSKLFSLLLSHGTDDDWDSFADEFDEYRVDSPTDFTFENPEEI